MVGKRVCICEGKEFVHSSKWMKCGIVTRQGCHTGPGVIWLVQLDEGDEVGVPDFCLRVASDKPIIAAAEELGVTSQHANNSIKAEIASYINELSSIYERESEIFIPSVINKLRQLSAV